MTTCTATWVGRRLGIIAAALLASTAFGCHATNPLYDGRAELSTSGGPTDADARPAAVDPAPADAGIGERPALDDARAMPPMDTTPAPVAEAGPAASDADQPAENPNAITCASDPTLALCMRFEGKTVDESPGRLMVTATAVGYGYDAQGGGAIFTDQTRLDVAASSTLVAPSLTIQLWVKPTALPTGTNRAVLVDFSRGYGLYLLPGGALRCQFNVGGGLGSIDYQGVTVPGALSVNVWSAVACVADAGRLSLRVDGKEVGALPLAAPVYDRYYGEALAVGRNHVTGGNPLPDYFIGSLDSLRIWRAPRPLAER